ncbi:MAG TPA: sigma-70 family RNA polymerase sigma factor [Acidimicrobiales bacterium]|nr:sigma-70 family RNA polymerase sigma factor [Acidimicrobiales bacterium]
MPSASPDDVERAIVDARRREWATVLAATAWTARDLDVAEECVQEAFVAAVVAWKRDGVPRNPGAWLTTVARRRAVDVMRREMNLRSKLPLLVGPEESDSNDVESDQLLEENSEDTVRDERLRMIFLCCHPALSTEAQMALTLRLVCGMSTPDIARVFLLSETTMGARLTRAKQKISTARIPLRMPDEAEMPDRLRAVLGVIYLLFTMGHTATSGTSLMRPELVDQAMHLTEVLQELMPDEREVRGLLALMLITDARRATRVDAEGALLRLDQQDRSQWDLAAIERAKALIREGLRAKQLGRFILQAAIALEHAQAPSFEATDWAQIVRLYDALLVTWPSPIVALNRAVAVSMVAGPEVALALVEELESDDRLADYHYLPAIKADLLRRLGRVDESLVQDARAIELTRNDAEREYLTAQMRSRQLLDE